jgi:hypothetical protein
MRPAGPRRRRRGRADRCRAQPAALGGFTSSLVQGYGVPREVAAILPITGDASRVAERFAQYEEAGAEHLA